MLTQVLSGFPADFEFGVATAAYQIEGGLSDGKGPCIWDSFAATGRNVVGKEDGRRACDHYHRWPEDLDLIRDGGFSAYRFSFAWPRLLPEGRGRVNPQGLAFYDRLLDGMLERGIKPNATLYHWDLPSALQDLGGWMNRDVADWFADYAQLVAQHFGDRLAQVATINEPWCVAFLSHRLGIHAPGYRDLRATARAMHHVLLAHGRAVQALRAQGLSNLGIVLNFEPAEAADDQPSSQRAAQLWDGLYNRWYLGGVTQARYPEDVCQALDGYLPAGYQDDMATVAQPLDWLGVNYYTRGRWRQDPLIATPDLGDVLGVPGPLAKTQMGWEIFPQGLRDTLLRIHQDYSQIPLYVTENGMAWDDHAIEGQVNDDLRGSYYKRHLAACLEAMEAGVLLKGYYAWSLLDNYEWAEGYSKRFGLVHVDYDNQQRTPKASYKAWQAGLAARAGQA